MNELQARLARALAPRYLVERELGAGGMGRVFLGRDALLERALAIKVLRPELATAVAVERFLREARTLAGLVHPHLVNLYDVLEPDGLQCLLMEYIDGRTLRDLLEGGARLPVDQVRTLGCQLLDALERVHARGIVHRDIKPSNVFVVADGAKLVDFGIASDGASAEPLTKEGQPIGTEDYMSPEQRAGRTVGPRSDLYSLGLVLLEAATGRRHASLEPADRRLMPAAMASVLQRAIADAPEDRWPSAAAFRKALAASARTRWMLPRVAWVAIGTAGLAAVAWNLYGVCLAPPQPGVRADEGELAILPFEAAGSGDVGWTLTRSVVSALEGFPKLAVTPAEDARAWQAAHPGVAGPAQLPAGARWVAEGQVHRRHGGDSLEVLIEVRLANNHLFQRLGVVGDTAHVGELAHDIADSLVRKLAPAELQDFRNWAFRPMADLQATNAFFEGEDAFQRGDWALADAKFTDALTRDPDFVQAAWSLMIARRFQRKPFGDVLAKVLARRDALPPFYRALLDAQLEPDLPQRLQRYEELVRSSNGSGEALLHYTNELFHRGALVGRPLAATLDTMSLLADQHREMRHASTYDLTIWGNLRVGREDTAWRQFCRREMLVPKGDDRSFLHRFALWARFAPWKAALVRAAAFRRLEGDRLDELAQVDRLGLSMDVPEQQVAIGRLLEQGAVNRPVRKTGILGQALGLMALGRPAAALERLDAAAALDQSEELRLQQFEWPVALSALGLPIDSVRVARGREGLLQGAWRGGAYARARFALGLDALARRDVAGARRLADSLAATPEPVAARLGEMLAAQVEAEQGMAVSALDRSRPVFVLDSVSYRLGPFARAATYLGRGAWQRALGRWEAADREWLWYENSDLMGWPQGPPQPGEIDAMLAGLGRLRRAELAIEHGEIERACSLLSRTAESWRQSDPEWLPLNRRVANAKERAKCP